MSGYRVFEATTESLTKRGEYECETFEEACILMLASWRLTRYNKTRRGEPMGTFHMLDVRTGELHWIVEEGQGVTAVRKLGSDDEFVLGWLTEPLLEAQATEKDNQIEELQDESDEFERERDKMEEKIEELMGVIGDASSEISRLRGNLDPSTPIPNFDDTRVEMRQRMNDKLDELLGMIKENFEGMKDEAGDIIENMLPSDVDIPDLSDIDSDLQSIESDLDSANGDIR